MGRATATRQAESRSIPTRIRSSGRRSPSSATAAAAELQPLFLLVQLGIFAVAMAFAELFGLTERIALFAFELLLGLVRLFVDLAAFGRAAHVLVVFAR